VHKNRTADVIIASRLHQSENWPENLRFASTKLVCDFFLKQFFYGEGTLITVFTMVTEALSPIALPSSVVIAALPAVAPSLLLAPTLFPQNFPRALALFTTY
jgi:hypothetical protein